MILKSKLPLINNILVDTSDFITFIYIYHEIHTRLEETIHENILGDFNFQKNPNMRSDNLSSSYHGLGSLTWF